MDVNAVKAAAVAETKQDNRVKERQTKEVRANEEQADEERKESAKVEAREHEKAPSPHGVGDNVDVTA